MSNINEPDPSRLIHGLRDTGYNINSAAADIVDNCIAADATLINVRTVLQPTGAKIVYFGDNGHGMNAEGVVAAMRYGADKRENLKSLGKFGLGLKTASSSICLKYSLVSRDQAKADLSKGTWDLDHVSNSNAWEMIDEPITADEELAFEELCGETGTLVIWQKCDRLLPPNASYDPGSAGENAALRRLSTASRIILASFITSISSPRILTTITFKSQSTAKPLSLGTLSTLRSQNRFSQRSSRV